MCHVEVRVWLILKALVCAHAVFVSGVTYSLQYVILEQGHLGKSLDISCRILEIAVKFASKLYNFRKLLSMYGVGHVDGIGAAFPAFGSLEKVAEKGSAFGEGFKRHCNKG